jgi:hypothetical protein
VELETGDIDWGQIDMLPDAHEATIDFSTTEDAELGIVVQEAGVEGGVARDIEALTVLDYHKTRNMFIDDLVEVKFLISYPHQIIIPDRFLLNLVGSFLEATSYGDSSNFQRVQGFQFHTDTLQHREVSPTTRRDAQPSVEYDRCYKPAEIEKFSSYPGIAKVISEMTVAFFN